MRVLALTKYGPLAASSRYRILQYVPPLRARGIQVDVAPLFTDAQLRQRFAGGGSSPRELLRLLIRRIGQVVQARRYDAVWLYLEAFPFAPPVLEHALRWLGVPYVVDIDDAIFQTYRGSDRWPVRALLGEKMSRIFAGASGVTAGSRYLVEEASRHSSKVHFVPTVVDMSRYRSRPEPTADKRHFELGWIGSPSTSIYLNSLAEPLAQVAAAVPTRLVAVGAPPELSLPGVPLEVRPWSEAREIEDLHGFDVGLMPLPDTRWAKGKCAFKLIQYLAVGVPGVASPVGANRDVLTPDVGRLAASPEAWTEALLALARDPKLARSLGRAGRARVQKHYSLESQVEKVADVLGSAP